MGQRGVSQHPDGNPFAMKIQQINMLWTLNLHNGMCQLSLNFLKKWGHEGPHGLKLGKQNVGNPAKIT